jgi:hypothetical protein
MIKKVNCTVIDTKVLSEQYAVSNHGSAKAEKKKKTEHKRSIAEKRRRKEAKLPESSLEHLIEDLLVGNIKHTSQLLKKLAKYFELDNKPLGLIIDIFM